jgi:hypothetical protein
VSQASSMRRTIGSSRLVDVDLLRYHLQITDQLPTTFNLALSLAGKVPRYFNICGTTERFI